MRTNFATGAAIALATVALLSSAASAQDAGGVRSRAELSDAVQMQIAQTRRATAQFHNLEAAFAARYGPSPVIDLQGRSCIEEPGQGAMGVHYANGGLLLFDPEASAPQALIYEPMGDGSQRLVGVEYIAFKSGWDSRHPGTVPTLYGQDFELVPDGNRYGMPAFYALHLWLWQPNRNGMFADWNPDVHCP